MTKTNLEIEHIAEEIVQRHMLPCVWDSSKYEFEPDRDEIKQDIKEAMTTLLQQRMDEIEESKNSAYKERDMLVCALSKLFPAYLARHDEKDTEWESDWRWIVYIEIPVREKVVSGDQHNHTPEKDWFKTEIRQVSWHIHDSEREMFNHLEVKGNNWDGHNTQRKYERLSALNIIKSVDKK